MDELRAGAVGMTVGDIVLSRVPDVLPSDLIRDIRVSNVLPGQPLVIISLSPVGFEIPRWWNEDGRDWIRIIASDGFVGWAIKERVIVI